MYFSLNLKKKTYIFYQLIRYFKRQTLLEIQRNFRTRSSIWV